ncbi:hypothetical protein N7533_004650 [Penicillium manginii]|uniref:uncharacterized protein n=1 Tax=Penicillium manginii TaxID=203109 RepID=UPI002546AB70|nr:uncharacterized protein N7533_004650 [Penicillium manginii]KAJ5755107.1 hypothetical protein N7533_004650 [Penicillium manginii]
MKLILTGSSGFVGRELLSQCLEHPSVTAVIALTRHELTGHEKHDKLKVVLMEDFSSYPETAREAIRGTLGVKPSQVSDNDMARRISIEYTTAAAWLFNDICQKPFRFVYCSGYLAERDQTKQLWYLQDYRRIRGQVETELLTFDNENTGFESYILQPAMIRSRSIINFYELMIAVGPSIKVDELASKMLNLALEGGSKKLWTNSEINEEV